MTATLTALAAAAVAAGAVLMWPRPNAAWRPAGRRAKCGARRGDDHLGTSVPEVLDLLSLALRGGADVQSAVQQVAAVVGGRAGRELGSVTAALAWGLDEDAAWGQAPVHWAPARRALALAATAGVPPAQLLADTATDLRRDTLAGIEVATARLAVRLVLPLGLAFLPAFLLTTVVPVVLALAQEVVGSV
ncbi:MAG: type II secretion system F family protein [Actinobacteria bacterium]|nr:type II secretion system F family protein [Actinomycetota bacterium]